MRLQILVLDPDTSHGLVPVIVGLDISRDPFGRWLRPPGALGDLQRIEVVLGQGDRGLDVAADLEAQGAVGALVDIGITARDHLLENLGNLAAVIEDAVQRPFALETAAAVLDQDIGVIGLLGDLGPVDLAAQDVLDDPGEDQRGVVAPRYTIANRAEGRGERAELIVTGGATPSS